MVLIKEKCHLRPSTAKGVSSHRTPFFLFHIFHMCDGQSGLVAKSQMSEMRRDGFPSTPHASFFFVFDVSRIGDAVLGE